MFQSFQEYLKEGGNVVLGSDAADRIDLTTIQRRQIVDKLLSSFEKINGDFKKFSGFYLWNESLFKSKMWLSGSAFHFFNLDGIDDAEFAKHKPSVGDIDTQVDILLKDTIEKYLGSISGKSFGDLKYIGFKKSGDQFISLWKSISFKINIQVDLEMVDFDDSGHPTQWSTFSHSSDWNDMKEGVKGVAHKYILRALSAKDLKPLKVMPATPRSKEKEIMSADVAFSPSGLRKKVDYVKDSSGNQVMKDGLPVVRELKTSETSYIRDLNAIFQTFFPGADMKESSGMNSFVGIIGLINKYYTNSQKQSVLKGFVHTLWGPGAQKLYRDDDHKDLKEKTQMFNVLTVKMAVNMDVEKIKREYYN